MQKPVTFLSLFLLLGVLSSASCEKETEEEPDTPEKLIVTTWLRTHYEFSNAKTNGVWVEWTKPACDYDDTEEFTKDGKWNYNAGALVCTGQTITTSARTYRLENNGTKIILITSAGVESTKNIERLENGLLITVHDMNDVDKSTIRTTYIPK